MTASTLSTSMLTCWLLWLCNSSSVHAFTTPASMMARSVAPLAAEAETTDSKMQSFDDEEDEAEEDDKPAVPAGMNPDRPELPELKGDFDWDAKFGDDEDWITEDVPGKIVLNEVDLASQVTELTKLEEQWRKESLYADYEESKQVGFVERAELLNGRTAMFFLVTGLLTEYWTGISMPGQVEEMLRIAGVIGFD